MTPEGAILSNNPNPLPNPSNFSQWHFLNLFNIHPYTALSYHLELAILIDLFLIGLRVKILKTLFLPFRLNYCILYYYIIILTFVYFHIFMSIDWLVCWLLAGPDMWKRRPLRIPLLWFSLVLFLLDVKFRFLSGQILLWSYWYFLSTSSCHCPICGSCVFKDSSHPID